MAVRAVTRIVPAFARPVAALRRLLPQNLHRLSALRWSDQVPLPVFSSISRRAPLLLVRGAPLPIEVPPKEMEGFAMTRKFCTFAAALITIVTSLVSITWAQAPAGGFEQFWGTEIYVSDHLATGRHPSPDPGAVRRAAPLEPDRDRRQRARPHAGRGRRDPRVFGEQLGPGRASRAMAIVHIAIFDAVNAIARRLPRATPASADAPLAPSMDAAIAQAAHDTLVALFPSQGATFDALLAEDLARDPRRPRARRDGIALGAARRRAILAARADDGSAHAEPRSASTTSPSDRPGNGARIPISQLPLALGAHWGEVDAVRAAVGQRSSACRRRRR